MRPANCCCYIRIIVINTLFIRCANKIPIMCFNWGEFRYCEAWRTMEYLSHCQKLKSLFVSLLLKRKAEKEEKLHNVCEERM